MSIHHLSRKIFILFAVGTPEQFYQALRLRKVDAALVRIPGASHGIADRPSQLIAKVAHILKWFEIHRDPSS